MKDELTNSIQITDDIHWIGFYDEREDLHCNPYIMLDNEDVIIFDPGSIPHFPIVMRKVIELVNPDKITTIVVHHQDPDVCGNLAVVENLINNPDLSIVTHNNNVRLLNHLGLISDFYEIRKNNYQLKLKSGRILKFIPSPFLHSPFGIVTYDTQTKTLFSSDIFGAISSNWTLFAKDDFLESMYQWHRMIMPSQRHLKNFMEQIETMDIERILPQHGSILSGDQVKIAIESLKSLQCGIDLQ